MKQTGGNPPYGYRWQDGELVVESNESPIYALMFDLFLIHQRKKTVAKILNEKGYRTRAAKEWSYTSVARMLKNPIAKGVRRYRETIKSNDGSEFHEWIETPVESVVSTDLWDQVNALMTSQAGSQSRRPTQDIFVGKIICECGEKMTIPSKSDKYICPKCETDISQSDLTAIFETQLKSMAAPDISEIVKSSKSKSQSSKTDSLEKVTKSKIKKIEHDIEKLYELHSSGAIPTEAFKTRFDRLEGERKQLESALSEPNSTVSSTNSITNLLDYWKALPANQKYIFTDTLTKCVHVGNQTIRFSFYPPFNCAQHGNT